MHILSKHWKKKLSVKNEHRASKPYFHDVREDVK